MVRITWLIAWLDNTWSLQVEDYNGHDIVDMNAVEEAFLEKLTSANLKVALVAVYHQENIDLEDG